MVIVETRSQLLLIISVVSWYELKTLIKTETLYKGVYVRINRLLIIEVKYLHLWFWEQINYFFLL